MKKNSIVIVDTKGFAWTSWKTALNRKYNIYNLEKMHGFEKRHFDLIILNMHSQKELDLNIFRRISGELKSVRVIVLSSYRYWSKAELMSWGVLNVVVKPFMIPVLEEKIDEVLLS